MLLHLQLLHANCSIKVYCIPLGQEMSLGTPGHIKINVKIVMLKIENIILFILYS